MATGTVSVTTSGVFPTGGARSPQTLPTPTHGGIAVLTYQGTSSTPATTSVAALCNSGSCPISLSAPIGQTTIVVQIYSLTAPFESTIPSGSTLLAFGSTTYNFSTNGTNSPSITLNSATIAGSSTTPGGGSTVQTSSGGGVTIPSYVPNYTATGSTLGAGTSIGFTIPAGAGLASGVAAGITDVVPSQLTVSLSAARSPLSIPSYTASGSSATNYFIYGFGLTLVNTTSPGSTVTAGSPLCVASGSVFAITSSTLQGVLGSSGTLYIAEPTGSTYTNVGTIAYTFSGNNLTTGTCTSTITQNGIYIVYLAVPANQAAPLLIAAGSGAASSGAVSATFGANQVSTYTFSESGSTTSTIYTVTGSGTACSNLNMSTHNTTQVVGSGGLTISSFAASTARNPQAAIGATDLNLSVSPSASGSCTLTITSNMTGTPSNTITITVAGTVTISQSGSSTTTASIATGSTQTFTVAQTNGSSFTVDASSTCGSSSATTAAAYYTATSPLTSASFTVTAVSASAKPNPCTVVIDGSAGQSTTLNVTATATLTSVELEVQSPSSSSVSSLGNYYNNWQTNWDSSLNYLVINNPGVVPVVVHGFASGSELSGSYSVTLTLSSSTPSGAFTLSLPSGSSGSCANSSCTVPSVPATVYLTFGSPSSCTPSVVASGQPPSTNCTGTIGAAGLARHPSSEGADRRALSSSGYTPTMCSGTCPSNPQLENSQSASANLTATPSISAICSSGGCGNMGSLQYGYGTGSAYSSSNPAGYTASYSGGQWLLFSGSSVTVKATCLPSNPLTNFENGVDDVGVDLGEDQASCD